MNVHCLLYLLPLHAFLSILFPLSLLHSLSLTILLRPIHVSKISRMINNLRSDPLNLPPPLPFPLPLAQTLPHQQNPHPTPPITFLPHLTPRTPPILTAHPPRMTRQLLILNLDLILAHRFEVRDAEQVLCCENALAQVSWGEPVGDEVCGGDGADAEGAVHEGVVD